MKKRLLSAFLVLAMMLSVLPMGVFAEENIAEGDGWYIDDYNCLHILEDLEIPDENEAWMTDENEDLTPWAEWKDEIRSVIIDEEVHTTVGAYLFSDCEWLSHVTISKSFFHSNNISYMFRNCEQLHEIDLSYNTFVRVSGMDGLFQGCSTLKKVNLNGLHYYADSEEDEEEEEAEAEAVKINGLFEGCEALTEICIDDKLLPLIADELIESYGTWYAKYGGIAYETAEELSGLKGTVTLVCKESAIARNIAEGAGWYLDAANCLHISGNVDNPSTTAEDQTPWRDVKKKIHSVVAESGSSVNNCAHLFDGCTSLSSLDLHSRLFLNAKNAAYMFNRCISLTSVELDCILNRLTDVSSMFAGCRDLRTLDIHSMKLDNSVVTNRMFSGCPLIECKIDVSTLAKVARELHSVSKAWTDKISKTVYTDVESLQNATGTKLDLYCGNIRVFGSGWHIDSDDCLHLTGKISYISYTKGGEETNVPWASRKDEIRSVLAHKGSSVTNCNQLFANCPVLTSADISALDMSEVKDFSSMFENCPQLESVDIIGIHTASAQNMNRMFADCGRLQELDTAYLETENVTDMADMFRDCSSLRSLDFSYLDVTSLETADGMLSGCTSLTEISLCGPLSLVADEIIGTGGFWYDESEGVLYDTAEKLNTITDDILLVKHSFEFDAISLAIVGSDFTVTASGKDAGKGIVMVALYDNENTQRLAEVKVFDLSKGDIPQGTFTQSGYVKAFWWTDLEIMTPLCESVDGTIE